MAEQVGLFEAKTKLSEICARVAETGQSVTITKRGKPLVTITPVPLSHDSINDRLEAYRRRYGDSEQEEPEFELPERSRSFDEYSLSD